MKTLQRLFALKKESDFINDRRQAKRYDLMLKLTYLDPITKTWLETLTKNISRTGLRFPVNSKVPKGTLLDIKVEDPNSNRFISLKTNVAWLEEFISGEEIEGPRYETGVTLLKKSLF